MSDFGLRLLGIWTQVLILAQQAFCPPSQLPNPHAWTFCTHAGDWTPVPQLIKEAVYPANVRRVFFFFLMLSRNLVLKYPMNIPL